MLCVAARAGIRLACDADCNGDLTDLAGRFAAAIVAMAIVAPPLFSGKPPPEPGRFPTEHDDRERR